MNCPICKNQSLTLAYPEPSLAAQQCLGCGGLWIMAADYRRWIENGGQNAMTGDPGEPEQAVPDSLAAKQCPRCGYLLLRYKVGAAVPFGLDRCGHCSGVWLDASEWAGLKARGLHGALHRIFTDSWQRGVRREEHRRALTHLYQERLGDADYAELRRIRAWLDKHEHRSFLLGYLNAPEPPDALDPGD
jgi:Zn-finger nucleic acid-binding protein